MIFPQRLLAILFLIIVLFGGYALSQIFIPMAFFGPKVLIPANASSNTPQCPATLTGSLSLALPYTSLVGAPATSCQIISQAANFVGVPVCACAAGVCSVTGLTIANNYLSTMTPGVSNTLTDALKYRVSIGTTASAAGDLDLVIAPQTWSFNCLGSMLKFWVSSLDATTVTTSYNTTAQYGTGTNGSSTFTSSVPPTYPIGSRIRIAGNAQTYDVIAQSISGAGNFNGSFEKPEMTNAANLNYQYTSTMSPTELAEFGWQTTGDTVVFENGSAWGYPNVPLPGNQGLSMQRTGTVRQSVYFPSTGTFTLNWRAVNRPPGGSYAPNPYTIKLNGTTIGGPYTPTSETTWQANSVSLNIVTSGYHTISFETAPPNNGTDYCLGLDNISLTSTVTVSPNLVANYTNAEVSVLGVSNWNDKSSYANHLTQTVATSNYPTWTTNYNGTSRAALLFNGGNLYLNRMASSLVNGTNSSSLFVVGAQTSPIDSSAQFALGYGGTGATGSRNAGKASGSLSGALSTSATILTLPSATWSTGLSILSGSFDAGSMVGSLNGNVSATTATAFNTTSSNLFVGRAATSDNYWAGALLEILVVDYGMNNDERVMIEGFLAHKFAITAILPVGHKYKTTPP